MPNSQPLRIGIVAGELSGDTLGEGLIQAIRALHPDAEFIGIGGPKMIAQGCKSLFDMEELAVMGLVEVLGRLPRLLKIKARLVEHFSANPPDVFIGIDAPDFNLRLERSLKDNGIKTVHYVSPSVWAWRQNRIHGIKKSTDLMLAFLPFEKAFYDAHNMPCRFIGHTLADAIPFDIDQKAAQEKLGLVSGKRYVAVLPGSRGSELDMLCGPFIKACEQIYAQNSEAEFVVALVNDKRREQFETAWQNLAPSLPFHLVMDTARDVISASDCVMLASGTVALECMLLGRPMVVGYKVNKITAFIAKRLVKTDFVSLPNILAGEELVKEYLLEECTAENLSAEILRLLSSDNVALINRFDTLHHHIAKQADKQAALAVLELIENR